MGTFVWTEQDLRSGTIYHLGFHLDDDRIGMISLNPSARRETEKYMLWNLHHGRIETLGDAKAVTSYLNNLHAKPLSPKQKRVIFEFIKTLYDSGEIGQE